MTYVVESFGCRASAADGDRIAAELEQAGTPAAAHGWRDANVVVVNTCAVTREAERSARALIRRVERGNPGARIVVTGCYAQRAPGEIAALNGVSAVVGNSHKEEVARVALGLRAGLPVPLRAGLENHASGSLGRGFVPLSAVEPAPVLQTPFARGGIEMGGVAQRQLAKPGVLAGSAMLPGRTRPVLKVQDGCGNGCSFCIIPETRGPSRSMAIGEVLAAARGYVAAGVQELVLSGINLGRWGRDLQHVQTLPELLRALLEETGLPRLRVSSVEPMDWTGELIGLLERYGAGKHARLAPHAHVPLQSGADAVLRTMHRRYRPWHYAEKLAQLRAAMPDGALGADVMVGFPAETDALFEESLAFIEAQPLTYLHLFPFSARPGTRAAGIPPVPGELVRERMRRMTELGERKRREFEGSFVGRVLSAVTLGNGTALTANFIPVKLTGASVRNRMVRVRVAPAAGLDASIRESSTAGHSSAVLDASELPE